MQDLVNYISYGCINKSATAIYVSLHYCKIVIENKNKIKKKGREIIHIGTKEG